MGSVFLILFVLAIICLVLYLITQRRPPKYPPGPWGMPILGHLLFLGSAPHKTLMGTFKKKYGPIVAVDFASFPTVAISDYKLLKEALVEMDLSGRPDLEPFRARSGGTRRGLLFSDGQQWVEQRRFTIRQLKDLGYAKKSIETLLHEEVVELMDNLRKDLGQPISTQHCFNAAVLNSLWTLMTGQRFNHDDPELIDILKRLTTNMEENNGLRAVGMFLPWFTKTFPKLSKFDDMMQDLEPTLDFIRAPINEHKKTYEEGIVRDYIDAYLAEINKTTDPDSSFYKQIGERSLLTCILDLFFAGNETTSTTLSWSFLYLCLNQNVQKKLQDEIDEVVGKGRLPCLADEPNMLYTQAVILEVLRMSSLAPLALFHSALKDVQFHGYHIPKDTMILMNLYSAHYDQEYWGDPEEFRPERFLTEDGKGIVKHEAFMPFGGVGGKRVCLGESLARNEIFIFLTALFQRFHVNVDPANPNPSIEPIVSFVLFPQPHKLVLTERN